MSEMIFNSINFYFMYFTSSLGLVCVLRQQESSNNSAVMKAALKSAKNMGIQVGTVLTFFSIISILRSSNKTNEKV